MVTIAASNRLGKGKENKIVIGMYESLSYFQLLMLFLQLQPMNMSIYAHHLKELPVKAVS